MSAIMHSLKLYTAREANLVLGRTGSFWQHENYDHVVRDEAELRRIILYVVHNPVKAGLVEHWEDWKWTYCKHSL
jgi:putative transposase